MNREWDFFWAMLKPESQADPQLRAEMKAVQDYQENLQQAQHQLAAALALNATEEDYYQTCRDAQNRLDQVKCQPAFFGLPTLTALARRDNPVAYSTWLEDQWKKVNVADHLSVAKAVALQLRPDYYLVHDNQQNLANPHLLSVTAAKHQIRKLLKHRFEVFLTEKGEVLEQEEVNRLHAVGCFLARLNLVSHMNTLMGAVMTYFPVTTLPSLYCPEPIMFRNGVLALDHQQNFILRDYRPEDHYLLQHVDASYYRQMGIGHQPVMVSIELNSPHRAVIKSAFQGAFGAQTDRVWSALCQSLRTGRPGQGAVFFDPADYLEELRMALKSMHGGPFGRYRCYTDVEEYIQTPSYLPDNQTPYLLFIKKMCDETFQKLPITPLVATGPLVGFTRAMLPDLLGLLIEKYPQMKV